jgi:RNA polymerase sigma factor (sigma-70 family)
VQLTGKRIEEIFPEFVREKLSEIPRCHETRMKVDFVALADYRDRTEARMMLPSPASDAQGTVIDAERKQQIHEVVKTLTYREREVIELRYGLDGGGPRTLEDVGRVLNISKERVRQIEARAIRQLQQPGRSQKLAGLLS